MNGQRFKLYICFWLALELLRGYFGVHVAFMLPQAEHQLRLYHAFVELSKDSRNSFATKAPYLSLQSLA